MYIIFDDEQTRYDINIERSKDVGIPFLTVTVIVDGREKFFGKLKSKEIK